MKKTLLILIGILFFAVIIFIVWQVNTQNKPLEKPNKIQNDNKQINTNQETTTGENDKQQKAFTLDEISRHNTEGDCWFIIHDKVYDVTSFISSHPGGKAILQGCGKDATELYETRPMGSGTPHSDKARNNLNNFYIGDLSR